jgi:drug/metabolite transporter (DMT)-like permease
VSHGGQDVSVTGPRQSFNATHALLLVVGLVGVSLSGPAMAAATAVPALAMSFWRTGLGALAIAPRALISYRTDLMALARRERIRSVFAGLMLAGHFATWVSALHYTSVASATALVCLQVGWVVVLARWSGTPVVASVAAGLILALTGVVVVSGVDLSLSTRAATGDLMALAGGLFGAVYITIGSRVREHATTTTYTFVCYSACALVLLAWCLLAQVQLTGFDLKSWALIALVTVMAQLLGHSVLNHLLAVMSPTVVSMALLLEVPGAALLAAVFLGQTPPIAAYAGLALICVGLALVVRARGIEDRLVEAPVD